MVHYAAFLPARPRGPDGAPNDGNRQTRAPRDVKEYRMARHSGMKDSSHAARAAFAVGALLAMTFTDPVLAAADMNKVVRQVFPYAEEGFDPAAAHDLYSGSIEQALFETLLTYDYLARPAKLFPLTAEALPEASDGGRTYTVRLKKGIYFVADPAFKGVKRE